MTGTPAPATPGLHLDFPRSWQAEILSARPAILPARRCVYPRDAEEVDRGALEVLIRPAMDGTQPFLATCALGFRDPIVPTGVWSCPHPDELLAVAGGYAYVIDITAPERFTMIAFRPVLEIRPLAAEGLMLFVGHHAILAWGRAGLAWQSGKVSDEGVTITSLEAGTLHGLGWNRITDKETAFALDLSTGHAIP